MMRPACARVDSGRLTASGKPALTPVCQSGAMFVSLLDRLMTAADVTADRRRAEPREAVAWAAELELDGRRHPIEIGNISTGGLMARADVEVPPQACLTLWIGGHRLTGDVRWQGDGRFGLRFDTPLALDSAVIERYRPAGIESSKQISRWMV